MSNPLDNFVKLPSKQIINLANIGSIRSSDDGTTLFIYNLVAHDPWFQLKGEDKEAFDLHLQSVQLTSTGSILATIRESKEYIESFLEYCESDHPLPLENAQDMLNQILFTLERFEWLIQRTKK